MAEQALDFPWLHIEFFTRPEENKRKSLAEGRPIFEDKEFVRLRKRGDRNGTLEAPAHQGSVRDRDDNSRWVTYAERFPKHYAAFKAGQTYIGEGTPLAELPFFTEAERAELRALNIHTAESLAGLDGVPLKRLGMGGREKKDKAQAYLDSAKGTAGMTALAAENAAMKDEMAALRAQMAEFMANKDAAPASAVPVSSFAAWEDGALKDWIAEKTGSRPKGNPSHATLVASADEINAAQAKAA